MKILQSCIQLNEMVFFAYHGVASQETKVGNLFTINLTIETALEPAAKSDLVKDTINYATLYQVIKKEMDIPSKLLENVCYRVAKRILKEFPQIERLTISLAKQNPPMGADILSAAVELIVSQ
ncbi:MAG: dihydroneopterin aldolase [Bacteroidales bacterium]|nr:dihydroneopterin aldolase [Bacteroidales bacterium]